VEKDAQSMDQMIMEELRRDKWLERK
jgi:hypothetical protein